MKCPRLGVAILFVFAWRRGQQLAAEERLETSDMSWLLTPEISGIMNARFQKQCLTLDLSKRVMCTECACRLREHQLQDLVQSKMASGTLF
jgi:hypothetical protein